MSTLANFGETSWDDDFGGGRNDFFNLKEDGQYKARIAGKPHIFGVHWVEANGQKRKVNCAGKDCILCKTSRASLRYLVPAIFRSGPGVTEGMLRITEFGPQVYGAIRNLYKTPDWGNPVNYDIIIDKSRGRGPTGTYFVSPAKEYPLTDNEKAEIREFVGRVKLAELSAPMTNEAIVKKLGPDFCAELGLSIPNETTPSADEFTVDGEDEFNSFDD